MGGWLHAAPWRSKTRKGSEESATLRPEPAARAGDPGSGTAEDLRGLCVSDSVCGMFAEIKAPPPHA